MRTPSPVETAGEARRSEWAKTGHCARIWVSAKWLNNEMG